MNTAACHISLEREPFAMKRDLEDGGRDAELVRRCCAGEHDAFGELIRRHQRLLYAVIMRVVNHPQDAADLSQQALLKAWESLKDLKDGAAFKGWLLRIGVNLARNHVSRHVKRHAALPDLERLPDNRNSESQYLDAEKRELLASALGSLPPRQQEVVTLRIDAELSFAEIGRTLGCKETNARVNYHHGMKRLARIIAEKEN